MVFNAEIPYGAYWSTPFARWQGSFADLHALEFAANTASLELGRRGIPGEALERESSGSASHRNIHFTAYRGWPVALAYHISPVRQLCKLAPPAFELCSLRSRK